MEKTFSRLLASSYGTELWEEKWEEADGSTLDRTVVRRPNAVGVVAEWEGKIVMIRQARQAVGDEACLEIPAGKIDPGETSLQAIQRELREECGLESQNWKLIAEDLYVSPGYTSERMSLYVAHDCTQTSVDPDEDEVIDIVPLTLRKALLETRDLKSLCSLLWFKHFEFQDHS